MLDISDRPQYKPLLYAIGFFHTIVQERRKFGALGWNVPYEFNQADLSASIAFLQNHLDELDPKKGINWITVRYMLCEVHYGGRVTDDFDRKLLNTYGGEWFGDKLFADDFRFFDTYIVPSFKKIDEYRKYIEELPLVDSPEVFGLHPNADIACQTKISNDVLDKIVSIQPKDSGTGSGETREDVVKRMAIELQSKLPAEFVKHEVKAAITNQGGAHPLNIFLGQEIDRMVVVHKLVRETLSQLKLAIDGSIIMSPRLQVALDALYDAKVPVTWGNVSWQSSTLAFWFPRAHPTHKSVSLLAFQGPTKCVLVEWLLQLSGFLDCSAPRNHAFSHRVGSRQCGVANGKLPSFMKEEDVDKPPAEGVYIHGLYLEGASWDRKNKCLQESPPKTAPVIMPVIKVGAINTGERTDVEEAVTSCKCPVYKRPNRTDPNFIFEVELGIPAKSTPAHWALRGIALLTSPV